MAQRGVSTFHCSSAALSAAERQGSTIDWKAVFKMFNTSSFQTHPISWSQQLLYISGHHFQKLGARMDVKKRWKYCFLFPHYKIQIVFTEILQYGQRYLLISYLWKSSMVFQNVIFGNFIRLWHYNTLASCGPLSVIFYSIYFFFLLPDIFGYLFLIFDSHVIVLLCFNL
jgi:hypothetical protein